jgi:hypothetical protein
MYIPIKSLLSERAIHENIVTEIEVTESTITVNLEPKIEAQYERPDAKEPVKAEYHDSETLLIQGLGIQGKALLSSDN